MCVKQLAKPAKLEKKTWENIEEQPNMEENIRKKTYHEFMFHQIHQNEVGFPNFKIQQKLMFKNTIPAPSKGCRP